ncbi:MAG: hypothetical protein K8953_00300, partial [Proteobacteria bacterium]|nr:hypothetical protein [Pseudomonadota bacterium]
ICTNYPFTTQCLSDDRFTSLRRTACTDDPFTTRCAGDGYNDLRVSFCVANVGTHPSCPRIDTMPNQVTAADWLASFDEPLATAASRDHIYESDSQFLIGRATDLDDGGIGRYGQHSGSNTGFTLADATFNGVALGGDATDGVAFFTAKGNSYAGVLSDTNLGAPLTDTTGSAKWIGSFQLGGFDPIDFVLTVSFGTGTRAGEVEALVQKYSYFFDHYIKGEFNDAGVITGTAYQGVYRTPDPANRGTLSVHQDSGELTGLIGEEGAVGTFIINRSGYAASGGFVARPSSEAELATLTQTCTDDPFNKLCTIGYESERNARIEHCITDGNANDGICRSANQLHVCIKHPFRADCWVYLSQYYEQARANRVAFCRTAGNARNEVCTVRSTVSYICTNYPFDAACLGDDRFTRLRKIACSSDPFATRCAGDVYNDLRVSFCEENAGNPACPTPEPTITEPTITEVATPQVTASVWADSFEQPLSHGATAGGRTQFLIGRETDLDTGGVGILHNGAPNYSGTSNLADATFNGVALGGDAADGISYFAAAGGGKRYAGVLSGTNLGAPLTDTQGSAKWIGSFILEGSHPTDFVLNISFGIGDGVGEVEAFTREIYDYHIQGEFDAAGVITGTARWGRYKTYKTNNVGWEVGSGKLTGLIGEEGAVGAFLISGWYGGFVARPPTATELQDLTQTCNDDPFNRLCSVGYESQRNALIEHCITGGNGNDERCDSVDNWYPCIRDPFDRCGGSFLNDYGQVRANRVAFCRTAGNANNALCTVEATYHYICTTYPFDAQCLSNNDYTQLRRITCLDDPFTTRCLGDVYNDLRVTFCTRNAGNPACPRPEPTTPQVTASVWADSFDTPLATAARIDDTNNKFLIGRATDLDNGGVTSFPYRDAYNRANLNLADATFNGVAL